MSGKRRICTHPGCESTTVGRRLCRRHYQVAWKAGELGAHQKLPPRPRKRTICPPEHKHAQSSTCYIQHQCRCDECCTAHNAREQSRRKLKAYGRFDTGLVDAGPVREHLLMLGEFGLGYKRVAALAGLGTTPVRTLIWGRSEPGHRYGEMQKRVKRETAEKILCIRPEIHMLAGGTSIPARGAHRRVQALVARGWSMSKIAERIGWTRANFGRMMQSDKVSVTTHRAIAALYAELWDQAPPEESQRDKIAASRARKHAAARNWAPPLAWDDIDLDDAPDIGDPDEQCEADEVAVELAVSGVRVKLRNPERREVVRRLHQERLSDSQIAARGGMAERTVVRIRGELDLPAWTIAEQKAGTAEPRSARRAAA